jgi:tetratricopeptide (TPR) repeat protein
MSLTPLLEVGWRLYRSGQFDAAAKIFRQALDADSQNAELHQLLGVTYFRLGALPDAENSYRRAIALRAGYAEAQSNLGIALALQGKRQDAVAAFRAALVSEPRFAGAHSNLGNALLELGDKDQALACFQEAVRWNPDHPDALRNLGALLFERGELHAALPPLRRANQIRPNSPELLSLMGATLSQLKNFEEAIKCFSAVLALEPGSPAGKNGLGIAQAGLKRFEEGVASFRDAIRAQPDYPEAFNNMGNSLRELGRLPESRAAHEEAIRLRPDYAEAYNNLGITFASELDLDQAILRYGQAIEHNPDHSDAHKNLGLTLLKVGDFRRGWEEFEWRWKCKDFVARASDVPRWTGEPLDGKKILLYAEQGFGDTLQFVRYAALVKSRGAQVIVECQKPLVELLKTCSGIDEIHGSGERGAGHDFELPFMSLPRVFETTVDTIPCSAPYLFADPSRIERWRNELAAIPGFKVGIVWQGSPNYISDVTRSFPLKLFKPLAQIPGVQLISLQKGLGSEQLESLNGEFSVIDLGPRIDLASDAFLDTAAVMRNLDLVVTADTAAGHLAGATGVSAWIAVSFSADYRWLHNRADSPWYPSVRLFRQERAAAWGPVFERIASALRERVAQTSRRPPIRIELSPAELLWRLADREAREEAGVASPFFELGEIATLRSLRDRTIPEIETIAELTLALRDLVRDRVRGDARSSLENGELAEDEERLTALLAEINNKLGWSAGGAR